MADERVTELLCTKSQQELFMEELRPDLETVYDGQGQISYRIIAPESHNPHHLRVDLKDGKSIQVRFNDELIQDFNEDDSCTKYELKTRIVSRLRMHCAAVQAESTTNPFLLVDFNPK